MRFLNVKTFSSAAIAAALMLMVSAQGTHAQDKGPTGSVSGKVVDGDGKAVADVTVRVMAPPKDDHPTPTADKPEKGKGKKMMPAVATGKTDANGEFKIDNVPAGDYVVTAGGKAVGMGHEKVTVKAGETATVQLTLMKKKAAA